MKGADAMGVGFVLKPAIKRQLLFKWLSKKMFPKVKRSRDKYLSTVTVQYLNESVGIQIDESRCQGCGTCNKVCPTGALGRGPIGGTLKGIIEKSVSTVLDPKACSYCGTCAYMCPWTAISLMKDGQKIPLEKLELVQKKALPHRMGWTEPDKRRVFPGCRRTLRRGEW